MYARPQQQAPHVSQAQPAQHQQQQQQQIAYQQQGTSYVSSATPLQQHQYAQAQPSDNTMVPAQTVAHPQLPQLNAYPHLQLQYAYAAPMQSTHQPPVVQTHQAYAQPTQLVGAHVQQYQAGQVQYRTTIPQQLVHGQMYAQPSHLQPQYRPVPGHPARATSPLAHHVQTGQHAQVHFAYPQQMQQAQAGVRPTIARPPVQPQYIRPPQPRPPPLILSPGPPRPPNARHATKAQIAQHALQQQQLSQQAQQAQQAQFAATHHAQNAARANAPSARAASVTVNGALQSASTDASMPSISRAPSPAAVSPGPPSVEIIEIPPTEFQASRAPRRPSAPTVPSAPPAPSATKPAEEVPTQDTDMPDATEATEAEVASAPAEPLVLAAPPTFPYFGKDMVPTYLPGQMPIGIGLGFGLPGTYGGFGVDLNGSYFEDIKGDMDGWLDHEGHNTDPLLQPGAAVDALSYFRESLAGMAGGTLDEWAEFVEEHFDDDARMQLTLSSASSGLRLFDLPSTSLPRFFSSFPSTLRSSTLNLQTQTESPLWCPPESPGTDMAYNALPRHGVTISSTGEWRWAYDTPRNPGTPIPSTDKGKEVVWQVRIEATYVPVLTEAVLKLENLEVVVTDWYTTIARQWDEEDDGGAKPVLSSASVTPKALGKGLVGEWGLPSGVMRMAEILDGMEEMIGVLEVVQGAGAGDMRPKDALQIMTIQPSPKKERPSPAIRGEENRSPVKRARVESPRSIPSRDRSRENSRERSVSPRRSRSRSPERRGSPGSSRGDEAGGPLVQTTSSDDKAEAGGDKEGDDEGHEIGLGL